jgi:hypothetical protein
LPTIGGVLVPAPDGVRGVSSESGSDSEVAIEDDTVRNSVGSGVKEKLKQARERAHIEAFRAAYSGFPPGIIEMAGRPDFTVTLGGLGQKLGIEHTEFFRDDGDEGGSPLKARESLQDKTVRKAREAYERKALWPVDVLLHWAPYYNVVTARVTSLAEEIADTVAVRTPEDGVVQVENTGLPESPLANEVNILRIARFAWMTRSVWNSARFDFVPTVERSEVQRILEQKEKNLRAYRKVCSQVWLLIVAEGFAPSSYGDIGTLREERFASSFDQVFFFRFFERDVFRLALSRP